MLRGAAGVIRSMHASALDSPGSGQRGGARRDVRGQRHRVHSPATDPRCSGSLTVGTPPLQTLTMASLPSGLVWCHAFGTSGRALPSGSFSLLSRCLCWKHRLHPTPRPASTFPTLAAASSQPNTFTAGSIPHHLLHIAQCLPPLCTWPAACIYRRKAGLYSVRQSMQNEMPAVPSAAAESGSRCQFLAWAQQCLRPQPVACTALGHECP